MRLALLVVLVAFSGAAHARPKTEPKKVPEKAPDKAPEKAPDTPDKPPEKVVPAPGDKRRIVGILDVRVEGVPKEIAAAFETDLEKQLDSRAYWLAPKSRLHEMMSNSTRWTEGCVVGPCLNDVKTQTRAELVVLAALTGSGTSFGYVVTLVRTDTGRILSQAAERCDVCTVNEALTNATLSAVRLLTAVPDKLPDEKTGETAKSQAATDPATGQLQQSQIRYQSLQEHHKKLGLVTLLAGLAIAGAGTAVYFVRDHADYGLATAAAGGGLAIGGLVVLQF